MAARTQRSQGRRLCGRLRARHARSVLRGRAALRLVLPHDRIRRHDDGGEIRPGTTGQKPITVRFDANVTGLPWRFEAETTSVTLLPGEVRTVYYKLTNTSDRETIGVANYGVSPDLAGGFFSKIQCFCFTDQTLQPGETREEAVVFFVDPAIEKSADTRIINTITLSYTFFPSKTQSKPLAANSGTSVTR